MRVLSSFIQATVKSVMDLNHNHNGGDTKVLICYRCKIQDKNIKTVCLNCNKVRYCNQQCLKKNKPLHALVCRIYLDDYPVINETMKGMKQNFENIVKLANRKNKK